MATWQTCDLCSIDGPASCYRAANQGFSANVAMVADCGRFLGCGWPTFCVAMATCAALIRCPQLPATLSCSQLPTLATQDLGLMAKMSASGFLAKYQMHLPLHSSDSVEALGVSWQECWPSPFVHYDNSAAQSDQLQSCKNQLQQLRRSKKE